MAGAAFEPVFGVPVSTRIASNLQVLTDLAAAFAGTSFNRFSGTFGPALSAIGAWTGLKNAMTETLQKPENQKRRPPISSWQKYSGVRGGTTAWGN